MNDESVRCPVVGALIFPEGKDPLERHIPALPQWPIPPGIVPFACLRLQVPLDLYSDNHAIWAESSPTGPLQKLPISRSVLVRYNQSPAEPDHREGFARSL